MRKQESITSFLKGCVFLGVLALSGGIACGEDALEFILAGARAVSVGTATFHDPCAAVRVVDGIRSYMERYGVEDINELVGAVDQ